MSRVKGKMTWFSKSLSRSWYSLVYINKMYTNCVCNIFYEFSVLCLREEKGKKFLRAETLQSMSLFEVISLWLNCSLAPSFPVRSDSSSFRMSSLSAILSLSLELLSFSWTVVFLQKQGESIAKGIAKSKAKIRWSDSQDKNLFFFIVESVSAFL